jgi:hypothetical protein
VESWNFIQMEQTTCIHSPIPVKKSQYTEL